MPERPTQLREDDAEAAVPLWQEALFGVEILLLHAAPAYYGVGVPRGDGSGVVIIPGFLGTDMYLMEMYAWLRRIGYQPYFSGIGLNAECPNLLIRRHLEETMNRARRETGRRIHIIGHSLGGIIARSVAGQRPDDIASVITLGSPFRGTVAHSRVLKAAEIVRKGIQLKHGQAVLPDCYTGRCTCQFLDSLRRDIPPGITETAIYTVSDGVVDWRYCITEDPAVNFEVPGTHIGLAFNPAVYDLIARRLRAARPQ
ncbi:MAG TPA: alpha/beta fold hydrolase [Bryobacteraceae bacterium]|jgi:triacylglycerol lipase|nr:alpha/beta fold hydrolase [Bryobacteraceae bacterium]